MDFDEEWANRPRVSGAPTAATPAARRTTPAVEETDAVRDGQGGDELMARRGGQWVLDTYRRHRGAYVGATA